MAQDDSDKIKELEKAKALAEAQANALDAQRKLIEAQKQLDAASKADDPVKKALDGQAAAAAQEAAIAASQKSKAEASLAALKAQFEVPTSGFTGEVKTGDKAGVTEAALLAAKALDTSATKIVEQVKDKVNSKDVLLYASGDVPTFQALIAFKAQVAIVEKAFADAEAKSDDVKAKAGPPAGATVEFAAALPAAGLALDAINKLLGFFRTDFTVSGVEVVLDDALLVNALAGKVVAVSKSVQLPAIYNQRAIADSGNTALNKLAGLSQTKARLQQVLSFHEKVSALYTDMAKTATENATKETDANKKASLLKEAKQDQEKAKLNQEAVDALRAAIAIHDSFFTKLTTPDDKTAIPLTSVIKESVVSDMLTKEHGLLMAVRVAKSGGAFYTKKNMWTFFGGMPFYNMGGVVVTFVLIDGENGHVLASGVIPVDGGFVKSSEIQKALDQ